MYAENKIRGSNAAWEFSAPYIVNVVLHDSLPHSNQVNAISVPSSRKLQLRFPPNVSEEYAATIFREEETRKAI
jgi:hypothetical protein